MSRDDEGEVRGTSDLKGGVDCERADSGPNYQVILVFRNVDRKLKEYRVLENHKFATTVQLHGAVGPVAAPHPRLQNAGF